MLKWEWLMGVFTQEVEDRHWKQEKIPVLSLLWVLQEGFSSPQENLWGLIDRVLIFDPYQFSSCCLCWYCQIIPVLLKSVRLLHWDNKLLWGFLVSQQRLVKCDRIDPGQTQTADPKVRLSESCCWNTESSNSLLLYLTHLKINKYNPWQVFWSLGNVWAIYRLPFLTGFEILIFSLDRD